jgi:hypothetical protein
MYSGLTWKNIYDHKKYMILAILAYEMWSAISYFYNSFQLNRSWSIQISKTIKEQNVHRMCILHFILLLQNILPYCLPLLLKRSPCLSALCRKHSTHKWCQPCWLLNYSFKLLQWFSDFTNKDTTKVNVTPRNQQIVEQIVKQRWPLTKYKVRIWKGNRWNVPHTRDLCNGDGATLLNHHLHQLED